MRGAELENTLSLRWNKGLTLRNAVAGRAFEDKGKMGNAEGVHSMEHFSENF